MKSAERPTGQNKPLVLVDVMNLSYRSHFAFQGLSHEGQPTGMFYGFLKAVLGLKKEFGDRLVFCWDYGLPGMPRKENWRKKIFPEYKAGRTHREDVMAVMNQSLPVLYQTLQDLGWGSAGIPGLEADDVMGLLTHSEPAYIFSTDKDLYQLLDGQRVRLIHPKKTESGYMILTQGAMEANTGLRPMQWAKYLAMGGDASDGIHVMPGIGPKTAARMVQAGADPSKFWGDNPESFQDAFPKCRQYWPKLMAAYKVAEIPRHVHDGRIREYVNGHHLPRVTATTFRLFHRATALKKFMGFCSDYGLMEFLVKREEFL